MLRNTAGQKWRVFAFNVTTNQEVLGDAANITAKLSRDYGTATALGQLNPIETEDGFYLFDLTQAETNAVDLAIYPESSTPDVQVIGVPGNFVTEVSSTPAPSSSSGSGGSTAFDGRMVGHGSTGGTYDFFCYNASNQVWNGSAFVAWNAVDFASYRVTASETHDERFVASAPDGTTSYELRARSAALATSYVVTFVVVSDGIVAFGTTGETYDFFLYDEDDNVWNGSAFVTWNGVNYVSYRVPSTELTGSGRFYYNSAPPSGTHRYELRVRGGTLDASDIVYVGEYVQSATAVTIVATESSLQRRVGHYLFGIRTAFSPDQTADIDDCIHDGLRRVDRKSVV